jgi:hypothetical protein
MYLSNHMNVKNKAVMFVFWLKIFAGIAAALSEVAAYIED